MILQPLHRNRYAAGNTTGNNAPFLCNSTRRKSSLKAAPRKICARIALPTGLALHSLSRIGRNGPGEKRPSVQPCKCPKSSHPTTTLTGQVRLSTAVQGDRLVLGVHRPT